jgi:hypothetical protein
MQSSLHPRLGARHRSSSLNNLHAGIDPPVSAMRLKGSASSESISSDSDVNVMAPSGDLIPLNLQGFSNTGAGPAIDIQHRFHGKASLLSDIVTTRMFRDRHMHEMGMRKEFTEDKRKSYKTGSETLLGKRSSRRPQYWSTPSVSRPVDYVSLFWLNLVFSGKSHGMDIEMSLQSFRMLSLAFPLWIWLRF